MILKVSYTINVGNMEFVRPEIEVDTEEYDGDYKAMKDDVFSRLEEIKREAKERNAPKKQSSPAPPALVTPEQYKTMLELADQVRMLQRVTEEQYDDIEKKGMGYTETYALAVTKKCQIIIAEEKDKKRIKHNADSQAHRDAVKATKVTK
jgi:hypothetical protein